MTRVLFSLSAALAGFLVFSGSVLANDFVTWHSSNSNVAIDLDEDWVTLRSATVNIPGFDGAAHGCVATASADVENPGPAGAENSGEAVAHLPYQSLLGGGEIEIEPDREPPGSKHMLGRRHAPADQLGGALARQGAEHVVLIVEMEHHPVGLPQRAPHHR